MNATITTIQKFCNIYSLPLSYNSLRLGLESMPSWPSLWSIYQFFNIKGIECEAAIGKKEDLYSLDSRVALIHTKIKGNDEILLVKVVKDKILYFPPFKHKWEILSDKILTEIWDGSLVFAKHKIKPRKNYIFPTVIFFVFISCAQIISAPGPRYMISLIIAISGIVTSIFYWNVFVLEKNKINIPFCNISHKFDCTQIATSSKSSFLGIPLVIYSLAYFIILYAWLSYFMIIENFEFIPTISTIAAIIFFPIIGYSLIVQLSLKKFCPFCIFILILIGIQSLLCLSKITLDLFFSILYLASIFIGIIALWSFHEHKKLIIQNISTKIECLRIKRDKTVIATLLSNSQIINTSEIDTPFTLESGSDTTIDIWITNNFKYCIAILDEIESLKALLPEFNINFYPICSFHNRNIVNTHNPLKERISKLCKSYDLSERNLITIKESAKLLGISTYPTVVVNGRLLPPHLTISDIMYSKCC